MSATWTRAPCSGCWGARDVVCGAHVKRLLAMLTIWSGLGPRAERALVANHRAKERGGGGGHRRGHHFGGQVRKWYREVHLVWWMSRSGSRTRT
jgi:hypothetical protein